MLPPLTLPRSNLSWRVRFGKNHPQTPLRFVTEASAALAQQIENGAPYDVFLSANAQFVNHLASIHKLRPESVQAYAEGRLGLLWKDGREHPLSDLSGAAIKVVALPNPKLAPYGVAAQQALEHAGIWSQVQPKVVYGENVRQTYQMFSSGNADAVITADSLLLEKHPMLISTASHQPILQKAGIVSGSKNAGAQSFLEYLTSPAGRAIFAKYGFSSPR